MPSERMRVKSTAQERWSQREREREREERALIYGMALISMPICRKEDRGSTNPCIGVMR